LGVSDFINIASLLISVSALIFAVMSFWHMNWRKGKLHVSGPRAFGAIGSTSDNTLLLLRIPFVFFNDGPVPYVINNLRLVLHRPEGDVTLSFIAIASEINSDKGGQRLMAKEFPVRGNEALPLICEFQAKPGRMTFEARKYFVELRGRLDNRQEWSLLHTFSLNIGPELIPNINNSILAIDNEAETVPIQRLIDERF
jgi:hypothetical protein